MPAIDLMSLLQTPKALPRYAVIYYCVFFTSISAVSDLAHTFLGWEVWSRPRLYVFSLFVTVAVVGGALVRRWAASGRAAGH
ncbi:MAG TPA: hypothetical protein VJU18_13985 [Vicinamibacteria bacterium]|nr:hypothetical protein [Vicinamibacteria bacterium]